MSEGRHLQLLILELGILRVQLFGDLPLVGGIVLVRGLGWGLYKSQMLILHNLCTRSFSIIDDLVL